jgi:hypothetical protein
MNIIDMDFEEKIKKLADFAEKNPFTTEELEEMHNKKAKPVGNIEGFFLLAPLGTKIVYCVENEDECLIRYLSISFMEGIVRPPLIFVIDIMKMIGFKSPITDCTVGFEEVNGKENIVIVREFIVE